MRVKRTGEYVGRALALVVVLVLVNLVPLFRPASRGVVLETWADVLWAINLSLVLQIVGNGALVIYRRVWLEGLLRAMFAGSGLLALIVFYIVLPLDFSRVGGRWLDIAVRAVLVAGMVGAFVDGIVQLLRFIGEGFPKEKDGGQGSRTPDRPAGGS